MRCGRIARSVHRDLEPGTVMLTPSGVKLLDFGLAKLVEHRTPGAASIFGAILAIGCAVVVAVLVQRASLSRDGSRLAFAKGRTVSNVVRAPLLADRMATWADVTQLTTEEANCDLVDVSRAGRLVLSADRSGDWE